MSVRMFKMEVRMESDPFRDNPTQALSRLAEEVSVRLSNMRLEEHRDIEINLYDVNGDKCGKFTIERVRDGDDFW